MGFEEQSVIDDSKVPDPESNRHIAMISIGGVIGTGLFLGTRVHSSWRSHWLMLYPKGLLLGYMLMGTVCYSVMVSLGEMIAFLPIPGGHIKLAERFVGPSFSFTMGWNYWYNWSIVLPTELSASAILIGYWNKDINPAAWITICMIIVIAINLLGAGGPDHDRLGFRFWKEPGPFVQFANIGGSKGRFLGFFAVLTQAAFSYLGTELVAIAAGEAKNPRRNIPKAIKRVYVRKYPSLYFLGTLVIGLLVPSNDPRLNLKDVQGTAGASPFVIAISRAGIKSLPSTQTFLDYQCMSLNSAWSAASSDLYASSRALCQFILRTSRNGLPYVAVIVCSLSALLPTWLVFGWFQNLTAVAGLMTWFGICFIYIRFYKGMIAQGISRKSLPYTSALQPYAAYYGAFVCLLISILSGWSVFLKGSWATDIFVTNYLPLVLFPIIYVGARCYYKDSIRQPHEMDFVTNIKEIEDATYDDPPPKNAADAFWQWLDAHRVERVQGDKYTIVVHPT
ncbi:amino acid permease [Pholiota molesta]|nr:amino acid permease [Pholiota molesta]